MWDPNSDAFDALIWVFLALAVLALGLVLLVGWLVSALWRYWRHGVVPQPWYPLVLLAVVTVIGVPYRAWNYGWNERGVAVAALVMLVGWLGLAALLLRYRRRQRAAQGLV